MGFDPSDVVIEIEAGEKVKAFDVFSWRNDLLEVFIFLCA